MKIKSLCVVLVFLCVATALTGQKSYIKKGDKYFERGLYYEALSLYSVKEANKDKNVLFRRAICNFHTNQLDFALNDFNNAIKEGNSDEEIFLYLGKIFHSYQEYEKAIKYYKNYLRESGSDQNNRRRIINDIKRCASGLKLRHQEALGFIENFGEDFNSRYDEINLIQSPNFNNKYYYSSNRDRSTGGKRNANGRQDNHGFYYFDMYSVENEDGYWMQTGAINPILNSAKHEYILDFSKDGNVLYYASSREEDRYVILTDTFMNTKAEDLYSSRLVSPILGEIGDHYISFFNDTTIVFSSKREGGYGGYDIYICGQRNGLWSEPKNLGPEINTSFDEICPFLSPNGLDLYFSHNGTSSIGGHDVFKVTYNQESGKWDEPKNIGEPVNSGEDDLYFRLNTDAISATFCSNRKTSFGGMDGYLLYMKNPAYENIHYGELPFIEDDRFIASNIQPQYRKVREERQLSKKKIVKNNAELVKEDIVVEKPVEIDQINVSPLYYIDEDELIEGENKEKMDYLVRKLQKHPQILLEIVCYSLKEGIAAYDLYYSIKRTEKIAEYIIEQGIDPQRLILKGAGSNYPLAKMDATGRNALVADKVNRRFDLILHNYDDLPVNISYEKPEVNAFVMEKKNDIYKTIVEGLSYKVQIAAVNRMYQNEVLKYYTDSMIEKDVNNGKYLYTLGLYDDYFSAKELYKDLKANDFSGIIIIPYKNGKRIRRNKIIDHAREFPDLVNYLQYN